MDPSVRNVTPDSWAEVYVGCLMVAGVWLAVLGIPIVGVLFLLDLFEAI